MRHFYYNWAFLENYHSFNHITIIIIITTIIIVVVVVVVVIVVVVIVFIIIIVVAACLESVSHHTVRTASTKQERNQGPVSWRPTAVK